MPGVAQTSVDEMLRDAAAAAETGVGGMILFGIPDQKDATGSGGWDEYGAVQQGVRAIKREFPELVVITDVCMCEYTDHGHCGVLNEHGGVDNDATLPLLARVAVSHAAAGADVVAPSDMMDGRIGAVRAALDTAGHPETAILSYAAKYASAFYGPFREAAESAPAVRRPAWVPDGSCERRGSVARSRARHRRGRRRDPGQARRSVPRRAAAREGGDAISRRGISGERGVRHDLRGGGAGGPDRDRVMMESLVGIRRAGADFIITYFAIDAARRLRDGLA